MTTLTNFEIAAKLLVDSWTAPDGGLLEQEHDTEISYVGGHRGAFLQGTFDAETLIEIAMHMRSTQE